MRTEEKEAGEERLAFSRQFGRSNQGQNEEDPQRSKVTGLTQESMEIGSGKAKAESGSENSLSSLSL